MKRVAVIYGGWSSEREVSLSSGQQMLKAAQAAGYDAIGIDATRALARQIEDVKPDVVLNGLHSVFSWYWIRDGLSGTGMNATP